MRSLSFRIRSVLLPVLTICAAWGCTGDRMPTSQVPEVDGQAVRPLGKLASGGEQALAVVVARATQNQAPVSGVTVELGQSVSGRAAEYMWSGTTNARGQARINIGDDRVTGYYRARGTGWSCGGILVEYSR